MTSPICVSELTVGLGGCGDPRESRDWPTGNADYVGRLGLTVKDIPELIEIAVSWADVSMPNDPDVVWAPIHAWHALAQLRAVEAAAPLVDILNDLDAGGDDWYLEEYPIVFSLIGAAALPTLGAFLHDLGNRDYPRICVAHALAEIAKKDNGVRGEVIRLLVEPLRNAEANDPVLNSFLVSYLTSLKAAEEAEIIERAYAGNLIDEGIVGHWGLIRRELGVEGLGLAPDDPQPNNNSLRRVFSPWRGAVGQSNSARSKNRAVRKRQRKNRRKNRR